MKSLLSAVLFSIAALAVLPGCKTTQPDSTCRCNPCTCASPCPCGTSASLGMMNDACPMSGKALTAASPASTWDNTTVGFCCNGCKSRFDGMSDTDKTAYLGTIKTGS
ncbi:MAG: hypothetical protein MK101_12420 [Phycisphaerales bacterium]|nr:hypothetical protein [Phycisphaerales bacterium]